MLSPKWPPHQITVNGGISPSLGHLVRPIQEIFTDLSMSNIIIFKYNIQTSDWGLLKLPNLSSSTASSSKGVDNISNAPYAIKEGDQLAVCSFQDLLNPPILFGAFAITTAAPSAATNAAFTPAQITKINDLLSNLKIATEEDIVLGKLKKELKSFKKASTGSVSGGKAQNKVPGSAGSKKWSAAVAADGGKIKRKEYVLKLRADLDSSDEEEEGDSDH